MDKVKRFVFKHFDLVAVLFIIVVVFTIDRFIEQKITFLNFYFIPVLIAGYSHGKRIGGMAALLCVAAVLFSLFYAEDSLDALAGYSLGAASLLHQHEEAKKAPEFAATAKRPIWAEKEPSKKGAKAKARTVETYRKSMEQRAEKQELGTWLRGLKWQVYMHIAAWGGFLFLSGVLVGALAEEKQRRMDELRTAYLGILEIMSKHVESADKETRDYLTRVSDRATEIAGKLEMSPADVEYMKTATLLLDTAKLGISIDLIERAATLSPRELEMMIDESQPHRETILKIGTLLDRTVPILTAKDSLRRKRKEKEAEGEVHIEGVPIAAQILDIIDAFDELTSGAGKSPQEAFYEIGKGPFTYNQKTFSAAKEILISSNDSSNT